MLEEFGFRQRRRWNIGYRVGDKRVRLVSDRMYEGKIGIKNRTGFAAVSIALAGFAGWGKVKYLQIEFIIL